MPTIATTESLQRRLNRIKNPQPVQASGAAAGSTAAFIARKIDHLSNLRPAAQPPPLAVDSELADIRVGILSVADRHTLMSRAALLQKTIAAQVRERDARRAAFDEDTSAIAQVAAIVAGSERPARAQRGAAATEQPPQQRAEEAILSESQALIERARSTLGALAKVDDDDATLGIEAHVRAPRAAWTYDGAAGDEAADEAAERAPRKSVCTVATAYGAAALLVSRAALSDAARLGLLDDDGGDDDVDALVSRY